VPATDPTGREGAGTTAGGAATQAGTDYENRIAAWAGVLMLAGQDGVPPWSLPPATTVEGVHCQTIEPIDDVLVGTSVGRAFIQAKHGLQFSQSFGSEFGKALASACGNSSSAARAGVTVFSTQTEIGWSSPSIPGRRGQFDTIYRAY
jgi:hypothetical protein